MGVDIDFATLSWSYPLGGFSHGTQSVYEYDYVGYVE